MECPRLALKTRAALGVSERYAQAPGAQLVEEPLDLGYVAGRLDQQVGSALPVATQRDFLVACLERPRERRLATRDQLNPNILLRQRRTQRLASRLELSYVDARKIRTQVRRRRDRPNTSVHRGACHLDSILKRRRTVVNPREHVGMDIDEVRQSSHSTTVRESRCSSR